MFAQKIIDKIKYKFYQVQELQEQDISAFKNRINFVCLLGVVVTVFILNIKVK